jgi:hypothetical protein
MGAMPRGRALNTSAFPLQLLPLFSPWERRLARGKTAAVSLQAQMRVGRRTHTPCCERASQRAMSGQGPQCRAAAPPTPYFKMQPESPQLPCYA